MDLHEDKDINEQKDPRTRRLVLNKTREEDHLVPLQILNPVPPPIVTRRVNNALQKRLLTKQQILTAH